MQRARNENNCAGASDQNGSTRQRNMQFAESRALKTSSGYRPTTIIHVELSEALPTVEDTHDRLLVLVKLHGRPIGSIRMKSDNGRVTPALLAIELWSKCRTEIVDHLLADGMHVPAELTTDGLFSESAPRCWSALGNHAVEPMISVVIATRERTAELERCLRSLQKQTYANFEIVVVENGTKSSSTADMIATSFADDSRIRYLHENRAGASLARNAGVAAANGEIIAFTDDDVLVDANWLHAIAWRFAVEPSADCVTGLVFPAELETRAQQLFEEYGGFNKGYRPISYTVDARLKNTSSLYPYAAGCYGSGNNASFRKASLITLGGFDLHLGPGTPCQSGEDLDMFLAVILNGGRICYEPAAIISHFHRADFRGLKRQLYNYGVGLAAVMLKWAMLKPRHTGQIALRVPKGIWSLFSTNSQKNMQKSRAFPVELERAELQGIVAGPVRYIRSRTFSQR